MFATSNISACIDAFHFQSELNLRQDLKPSIWLNSVWSVCLIAGVVKIHLSHVLQMHKSKTKKMFDLKYLTSQYFIQFIG